jgi:hypothetical protein
MLRLVPQAFHSEPGALLRGGLQRITIQKKRYDDDLIALANPASSGDRKKRKRRIIRRGEAEDIVQLVTQTRTRERRRRICQLGSGKQRKELVIGNRLYGNVAGPRPSGRRRAIQEGGIDSGGQVGEKKT